MSLDKNPEMNIEMDSDVKRVLLFMHRSIVGDKLRGVAEALHICAPAIWGDYPYCPVAPMRLREPPLTRNTEPR